MPRCPEIRRVRVWLQQVQPVPVRDFAVRSVFLEVLVPGP